MLTIRRTRVLRGPNIWAPVPVIILTVAIGELEARLCRETPIFSQRLIALVPIVDCDPVVARASSSGSGNA
jgi:hypothetical protein